MADILLRLRINYTKEGRLRFLSHLEISRALERLVRRANLPYAISQGFNAHMRFASGPALPVGTEGIDEYFDVFLAEYVVPEEAQLRLQAATVEWIRIISVDYADMKSKGLQATHRYETYLVAVESPEVSALELENCLHDIIVKGTITKFKRGIQKNYDLLKIIKGPSCVQVLSANDLKLVLIKLKTGEEGSVRPEDVIESALVERTDWRIRLVTRIRLAETPDLDNTV